ncbi:MAG TPA: TetR/AcrR family transcriptional regulator [Phenylobacterium sp.]|uniref:TetR/AcrR family transcriptional regulator n=1 Tax=Phenylobacterium sp. TaxID=1871053 RepID=UPI002B468977|nr:TetR/AcrR family transcriptional regulator [Phenylobacterium sp.]HKR90469.1 TetR/AcrR family transcriptional regulator [Phenylobacterium sp.]
MSTPAREMRREDRRDAILDVAYECFVADGYGSTSMSTIAARLGGSKGTLYNYFRSKEELFAAFVRRSCSELRHDIDSMPPEGDLRGRLVQMARHLLDHLLLPEAIAIYRVVVGEGERFPELTRLFYEAGPRAGVGRMGEALQDLMERGELRRADPMLAAHQFKDLALSGVYNLRLLGMIEDPTPEERTARAEIAVDTFLRAYAP